MARIEKLTFEQYLVKKGVVSDTLAIKALKLQRERTPPFEEVALRMGHLPVKAVFLIYSAKAGSEVTAPEACRTLGLLSDAQITEVIEKVAESTPPILDLLVELGAMSREKLGAEQREYDETRRHFLLIADKLKNFEFFKSLAGPDLESLAHIAQIRASRAGEVIVREGDKPEFLSCVVSGCLRFSRRQANSGAAEPAEVYIGTLTDYDLFGEAALFSDHAHSVNVIAELDSELICFEREDFLEFLRRHPMAARPILIFIIRRLAEKLNMTSQELVFERRHAIDQTEVDGVLKQFR